MSQMLAEIHEQPELLESQAEPLLEQARTALPRQKPQLVVFVARGSSDNACLYARYLFEIALGIPTSLAAPSVLTRYKSAVEYPPSLFIGVSQSAAAPDVAAVLNHARNAGHSAIAITNEPAGEVIDAATGSVLLNAGPETSVAATKTFTLTLLALYQICRAMGASLPKPELKGPAQAAVADPQAAEFGRKIARDALAFSLARGYHFSIACEAALKLIEGALIPCKPFSLADFAHGPIALAGPEAAALTFGADTNDPTALEVRERLSASGTDLLQAPVPNLPEELQPIASAIFAQRVALEAALAKGLDPDRPRNLTKVTKTR